MKTIRPTAILDYYDGVQIFEGRDAIGGHYIGVLVDVVDKVDQYLVTGAVPERLRQFRSGVLDLRTLLLEAPGGEWYLTLSDGSGGKEFILRPQAGPLVDKEDFLPLPGLLLDDDPIDDRALREARERHNIVFEFRLQPPEAAAGPRVRAATLAGLLQRLQTLLKCAGESVAGEMPPSQRPADVAALCLMDVVVPAAPGSFRVLLEAAAPLDTFGPRLLLRSLERVDALFATADDPEQAAELLKPYLPDLTAAYRKLLDFLAEQQTSLWYAWAEPTCRDASYGGVSAATAGRWSQVLAAAAPAKTAAVPPA